MNLSELQAELRHFAAERDWQRFHTPKNLSTALMVEAAELAEIFQWMTPEESQAANLEPELKEQIADEVADVLLYLLQVADHCQIDIAQAAAKKLARNAVKYPPARTIVRASPTNASVAGVHVLLDYENVQPSEEALRALVPDASQVWVFHGPHQRQVEQCFAGFGEGVTVVPIRKTGKNALDFHLSFYMGYIASRNPSASLVVVANDKGYTPMLEHAKAMGIAARQEGHSKVKQTTPAKAKTSAEPTAAKKASAKKAAVKKAPAKKAVGKKWASPAAEAAPRPATTKSKPAKKASVKQRRTGDFSNDGAASLPKLEAPASPSATPDALKAGPGKSMTLKRLTESLRKMGDKRPTRPKSLWRSLKAFLGSAATEDDVEHALGQLMDQGVVKVDSESGVTYPLFLDADPVN